MKEEAMWLNTLEVRGFLTVYATSSLITPK